MPRLNSFHLPSPSWPREIGATILLEGSEARHMLTVLRSKAGQTVRLFDGEGREGLFRLIKTNKKQAVLEALELKEFPPYSSGVTLAIGWGKSKRRNYLFEKVVELQGNGLIFWSANRSQGHLPSSPKDSWREKCLQAAKQCGSLFLPQISVTNGVDGLKAIATDFDQCYLAWESDTISSALTPSHLNKGRSLVVIGPEGGFDDSEAVSLIDAGFVPVSLGNSILRWETAASYCLSLGFYARQVD